MTITGYRRFTIVLTALAILLAGLSVWLLWELSWLRVHLAFATEQTEIFQEMRARALRSDVAEAAGCLQYAVHYYPSGTKQEAGSRLDGIVERERARAVHDILAYLRSKTGQDLGDDPEIWIAKLAAK
jgi:hypothetical protein